MSSVDFIKNILSGNVLTSDFWKQNIKIIVLTLLAVFMYIYIDYSCMLKEKEVTDLQEQIEKAKNEMLVYSTEYTNLTRPSTLSKNLKNKNNPIKEANTPPIKVK